MSAPPEANTDKPLAADAALAANIAKATGYLQRFRAAPLGHFIDGEAVRERAGGVGACSEQEMTLASWRQELFNHREIIGVIEDG